MCCAVSKPNKQPQQNKRQVPAHHGTLPADSRSQPFHDLHLMELAEGLGKTRIRQHANPLRREFQTPLAPPDWSQVFSDPSRPLVLDLGCGPGRFLLLLHQRQRQGPGAGPGVNYLGLEIRKQLVDRANEWAGRLGCQDVVHYAWANATVSLGALLASYPGPLASASIQFPDPHFKRRHRKRRMLQPQLVGVIRDMLVPGGTLFLQSDVEAVSVAMRNTVEQHAGEAFRPSHLHNTSPVFFSSSSSSSSGSSASSSSSSGCSSSSGNTNGSSSAGNSSMIAGQGVCLPPHAAGSPHGVRAEGSSSSSSSSGSSSSSRSAVKLAGCGGAVLPAAAVGPEVADEAGADVGSACGADGGYDSDKDGDMDAGADKDDDEDSGFISEWAQAGWLAENPLGVPTEREVYVEQRGLPVYRLLLTRL